MTNKIQHLMIPYCLKSIHHLSTSKSYVWYSSIFKVMITNSLPLGGLYFRNQHSDLIAESSYELWGIGPKHANTTLLETTKMEQDMLLYHLVNIIAQIACIISNTYKDGLQLIHVMLI